MTLALNETATVLAVAHAEAVVDGDLLIDEAVVEVAAVVSSFAPYTAL